MSSRCPEAAVCLLLAVCVGGCSREERRFTDSFPSDSGPLAITQSDLRPGGREALYSGGKSPYDYNAQAISQGKELFDSFNCSGCHAHGGGAIGPALMDDKWIYGSAAENIYATIMEGRPNGMPSFRGRIPPQQVWQLVAYVRSMSGQVSKDAAPSRSDHLFMKKSEQSTATEQQPPVQSAPQPQPQ
jgi:cytochrome c oxidase cbb3-type subunit III